MTGCRTEDAVLIVVHLALELQIPSSHEDPKTPLSKVPTTKDGLIDWSQVCDLCCFYDI